MIDQQIDLAEAEARNFGVSLRSDGNKYFIPTDAPTKMVLREVLTSTVNAFAAADANWEEYDISEDYGDTRPIYAPRSSEYFTDVSSIYELGALSDLSNLNEHISDVDYYFCEFYDADNSKLVGVKKATQLKSTLAARNKLVRIVDDTLQIIPDSVLKIDPTFDALISNEFIFILKPRPLEYIANIVDRVAGAAADKVQFIHDNVPFLDLSRIKTKISQHPRLARLAASIASRDDLANFQREKIELLAARHGVTFKEIDGRLRCNVADEGKLLEMLDARRYHLDLTTDEAVPYRASARQRV